MPSLAVITGANRGIGFQLAREFCAKYRGEGLNNVVIVTSRDIKEGHKAVSNLEAEFGLGCAKALQLDVTSAESVATLARDIKDNFGYVNVLVNNAGHLSVETHSPPYAPGLVRLVLETNASAVKRCVETFLPLMKPNGRVLNVVSTTGVEAWTQMSLVNRQRLADPSLSMKQLDHILEEIAASLENNTTEADGWSSDLYATSKLLAIKYTELLGNLRSRSVPESDIVILGVCPGFCPPQPLNLPGLPEGTHLDGAKLLMSVLNKAVNADAQGSLWCEGSMLKLEAHESPAMTEKLINCRAAHTALFANPQIMEMAMKAAQARPVSAEVLQSHAETAHTESTRVETAHTEAVRTETAIQTQSAIHTESAIQTQSAVHTEAIQAQSVMHTEAIQAQSAVHTESAIQTQSATHTEAVHTEATHTETAHTETALHTESARTETAVHTESAVHTEAVHTESATCTKTAAVHTEAAFESCGEQKGVADGSEQATSILSPVVAVSVEMERTRLDSAVDSSVVVMARGIAAGHSEGVRVFRNRSILYVAHPHGMPEASRCFEEVVNAHFEVPTPLPLGALLLKNSFLSMDPYMRGRMVDRHDSYIPPFQLGQPIAGYAVAQVLESNNDEFEKDDFLAGLLPWSEYLVYTPTKRDQPRRIPKDSPMPISYAAGVLGMPGWTAWLGLVKLCEPKAGETLVVSAAAGAVGQLVGQIGRQMGLRVVGSAGSEEKVRYLLDELKFDAAFNYKECNGYEGLLAKLKELCPSGIDCYFDGVGGAFLDAVLALCNAHARVAECGMISEYNNTQGAYGLKNGPRIVMKEIKLEGFIVSSLVAKYGVTEAMGALMQGIQSGAIVYKEDIIEGPISEAPNALVRMLKGENFGKQLLKIASPEMAM